MTTTIVVGAGLGGLVAARELTKQGGDVIVLESGDDIGGQIRTVEWHGLRADVGAEAMFLGGPHLKALIQDLGLLDDLVTPTPGSSWLRHSSGKLVKLPAGVGPTGPSKIRPVLESGLLSPAALARAGLEPIRARKKIPGDIAVGHFVAKRFGRQVANVFVDPLLGNLHAGDIDRLSLVSTAPQLVPAAREGRSLLFRRTPPAPPSGPRVPPFASFSGGLEVLIRELAQGLDIRTNEGARTIRRTPAGWDVVTSHATLHADRLVIATSAAVAGSLLEPTAAGIRGDLAEGRTADVATILLAYPVAAAAANEALSNGNGILLQSDGGRLLKAATFLSRKWTHLKSDEIFVVRASAGRAGSNALDFVDDTTLTRRVHSELADLIGLDTRPIDSLVTRWPGSYPQLEVGHAARMANIREKLRGHPVTLVGAPYDGLGMPSVVKSALGGVGSGAI